MKKILFAIIMLMSVVGVKAQSQADYDFLYNRKGWEGNIEIGANYSFDHKKWIGGHEKSGDVLVGAGYNFNENIYVGVESGILIKVGKNVEWQDSNEPTAPGTVEWKDANLVPVLADFRYQITTHKTWHPFVEVRGGYAFVVNGNGSKNYAVLIPRLGANFRMAQGIDLHIAAGYVGLWSQNQTYYKNLDGITVQAGIGIHF